LFQTYWVELKRSALIIDFVDEPFLIDVFQLFPLKNSIVAEVEELISLRAMTFFIVVAMILQSVMNEILSTYHTSS